jgi:predicted RNA-binding Zn ribbon-like protein
VSKQQQAPGTLEVVREFVNTVDLERGEEQLGSAPALASWLVEHGLASAGLSVTRGDVRRAVELREALRSVLLSHNGGTAIAVTACQTLDSIAARARVQLRFRADGGGALEPQAGGADGALGRIVTLVHAAIAAGTWSRLKACREHTCEWAFYDHTKNRSGAWCNMRVCGNRAKARAFRDRHAAGEQSRPPA